VTLTVVPALTEEQLDQVHQIRHDVFVGEQGVEPDLEADERDRAPTTVHLLATIDGGAVATARLIPTGDGSAQVGRVAVLAHARGTGVGAALMRAAEDVARNRMCDDDGQVRLDLSVQVQAAGFYRRLGYVVSPKIHYEAGIAHHAAHKQMRRVEM